MSDDDDDFARRGARRTDPGTSHEAAARDPAFRSTDRMLVLYEHARHPAGLTDFELAANLGRQQTSVGKRRGELRDAGLIFDTGLRRDAPSGSPAIVWAITAAGLGYLNLPQRVVVDAVVEGASKMKFSLQQLDIAGFRAVTSPVAIRIEDLPPGLFFVAGENKVEPRLGANGCGKSTVFPEAMLWCLYGITSRDNRPSSDVENWAAAAGNGNTSVTCSFAVGNNQHTLMRGRKPSRLLLDGDPVEQAAIDKLLPLNAAALRRTILIDQFGRLFLSMRPEEKSQIFSETLNLGRWIDSADKIGDRLRLVERDAIASDRQIAAQAAQINEIDQQLAEMQRQADSFSEAQRLSLAKLHDERIEQDVKVKDARTALAFARNALERIQGDAQQSVLDQVRAEARDLTRQLGAANAAREAADREWHRLHGQLAAYGGAATICPECGQEVTQEHIDIKRAAIELAMSDADIKRLDLAGQIIELPKQIEDHEASAASLEAGLQGYHQVKAEVALYETRWQHEQRALNSIDGQIEEVSNRTNTAAAQVDVLTRRLDTVRQSLADETTKHTGLIKQIEMCKFWQKGMREIRLEQIDATLIELEVAANRHAETLGLTGWTIRFATERETQKGVSHTFTVSLTPPNQTQPISWESYSGGESQRWQLAVTFALSEILLTRSGIDTDIEILDEPTAHLSPEGIEDLLVCLRERALEYGRRIFIIDHHALDRGAFDGVFMITKSTEGVSVSRSH